MSIESVYGRTAQILLATVFNRKLVLEIEINNKRELTKMCIFLLK